MKKQWFKKILTPSETYFLLCFCMLSMLVNASNLNTPPIQNSVSGVVTTVDGTPLPGVAVTLKGTSTGVVTDFDGNYEINVSGTNAVLVFSYIGFATKEVSVNNQTTINVTLQEDVSQLDEVVVVGYGTQKKSDITGAVSSVKSEDLVAYPVQNAEQALQGRVAGVNIQTNNGGEPGAPLKIRIRGGTSINAGSDPLIVVDGFVGAQMPPAEDIASMEVLKDASATAIYGSRGANGVIMVTTKKGKIGKASIELNSSYSLQEVTNELDMLNADQFAQYRSSYSSSYVQGPANTDWQDEIYRTGAIANHQVSVSGATDDVNYYVSGTFFDQEGVVLGSDLNRFSFLSNVNVQATEKLKVGMNLFGNRISKDGVPTQTGSGGTGQADVISSIYRFAPDLGIYDANGDLTINSLGDDIDNPFAVATLNVNEKTSDLFRANLFAELEIFKGLSFKTTFGFNTGNTMEGRFVPSTLLAGAGIGGEANITTSKSTDLISENYLTYDRTFGNHALTLMGGYSYQKNKNEYSYAASQGFVTDNVSYRNLSGGAVYLRPDSGLSEIELVSMFGRLNYGFDDRYLITFTARRDGSSNFSKNHKYAFFPSGALAWNMSNESFLENSNTISNWKWRGSYGLTGNQAIPAYGTLARFSEIYTVIGDNIVNSVAVTEFANDNLKWETSYQLNVGVDLGFFGNRLNTSFDYYNIETKDLLFPRPLPEISGIADAIQTQNIGSLVNKGFEIFISSKNILNENFTWTTDFNISKNINEITKLPDGEDIIYPSAPGHFLQDESQILREGEPVGAFYGYIYDGVIQDGDNVPQGFETQPGGELFRDIAGRNADGEIVDTPDGMVNSDDKTIIGDPNPDFTGGLNNTFTYKGLDFNIFFQTAIGGDILDYTLLELGSGDSNATTEVLNAWTPTNTNTNVPSAAVREKRITSRYIYDGSYVRLKNVSLGYSLPSQVVERLGVQNLRFYISGQNLLTFTDYPGLDPETSYRSNGGQGANTNLGLAYGNYPNVRSFTLGMNLKF
ncbi:SusC/RagA family TonB-linked outer membrane protein [Galbibacter mesophilus]|uniref:SusC/RagA family TonB-linked outer membrane protein n=1 Tax=Galbibacter mesophilus TaxID=379069 RepID=UPI00191E4990|nr:TonB-dependent receptor [Galbibacter mesophilus]MCM5662404.1 TonB-dependent receptor [Galbibacter mesophilus]